MKRPFNSIGTGVSTEFKPYLAKPKTTFFDQNISSNNNSNNTSHLIHSNLPNPNDLSANLATAPLFTQQDRSSISYINSLHDTSMINPQQNNQHVQQQKGQLSSHEQYKYPSQQLRNQQDQLHQKQQLYSSPQSQQQSQKRFSIDAFDRRGSHLQTTQRLATESTRPSNIYFNCTPLSIKTQNIQATNAAAPSSTDKSHEHTPNKEPKKSIKISTLLSPQPVAEPTAHHPHSLSTVNSYKLPRSDQLSNQQSQITNHVQSPQLIPQYSQQKPSQTNNQMIQAKKGKILPVKQQHSIIKQQQHSHQQQQNNSWHNSTLFPRKLAVAAVSVQSQKQSQQPKLIHQNGVNLKSKQSQVFGVNYAEVVPTSVAAPPNKGQQFNFYFPSPSTTIKSSASSAINSAKRMSVNQSQLSAIISKHKPHPSQKRQVIPDNNQALQDGVPQNDIAFGACQFDENNEYDFADEVDIDEYNNESYFCSAEERADPSQVLVSPSDFLGNTPVPSIQNVIPILIPVSPLKKPKPNIELNYFDGQTAHSKQEQQQQIQQQQQFQSLSSYFAVPDENTASSLVNRIQEYKKIPNSIPIPALNPNRSEFSDIQDENQAINNSEFSRKIVYKSLASINSNNNANGSNTQQNFKFTGSNQTTTQPNSGGNQISAISTSSPKVAFLKKTSLISTRNPYHSKVSGQPNQVTASATSTSQSANQITNPLKSKCSCLETNSFSGNCSRSIEWLKQLSSSVDEVQNLKIKYEQIVADINLSNVANQAIQDQIDKDVGRTYPDLPYFGTAKFPLDESQLNEGLVKLRRVLKVLAYYDPSIGYVQGMNFIAAHFLIHAEEHITFWLLVKMLNQFEIRDNYFDGLPGLWKHCAILDELIRRFDPGLAEHLVENGIRSEMFLTPWLLSIFGMMIPLQLLAEFYDRLMSQKWCFFYKFVLNYLTDNRREIMAEEAISIICVLNQKNNAIQNVSYKSETSWIDLFNSATTRFSEVTPELIKTIVESLKPREDYLLA